MGDTRPGEFDPTRIEDGEESSTVDAPARWSGSAVVPPPTPKKSRWNRRRPEPDERAAIPAVDPWAGQDTPWDPFPAVPEIAETDPTKLDHPAAMPPTRIEPPPAAPPPPTPAPVAAPKAPAAPAAQRPPVPPKPSRRERKARERANQAALAAATQAATQAAARAAQAQAARPPANRLPVQTRPGQLPPVPPWAARPPQRPLPPPRRKRRWGRRLALLTVLGVLCCCGLPFAYFQFPAARQYPVTAKLPTSFSDLELRDDNASKRAADRLAEQLRATATDGAPFAGVYGDSRGKRVTVFGVTGWRFTPKSDVQAQLDNLTDQLHLSQVQSFDLGETGAHESCGAGRVDGSSVVVCAWADHGSLATVLLTRRSISDSAELVSTLRSQVLTPG
ncbi:hypothetical protein BJ973_005836 [Actinoplanes tereljensis]|uniref:Uncharacterized protein n=1 Tax=Paractinoplanes tereljensis TaxID=571912 RepID=A0A919NYA1_9ACTN|nr:hypothetical protein [Actinoplanes tereljensis]GIF26475.1 hypothetical protein Ate02nite_92050 [Actinoplanes tereljensis]